MTTHTARDLFIDGWRNAHAMSAMGNLAAMSHAMAEDEVLKNTFANAALENYEIAAYTSLLTMAERAGIGDTNGLRQSLQEEIRMAEWVEDNVRNITMQFLFQQEGDAGDRIPAGSSSEGI